MVFNFTTDSTAIKGQYFYTNWVLDSIIEIFYTNDKVDTTMILYTYWDIDESNIKGNGLETIFLQKTSGDTVIYQEKYFSDGNLIYTADLKSRKTYFSELTDNSRSEEKTFDEYHKSNDTITRQKISDYNSASPVIEKYIVISDSLDDMKCYEILVSNDDEETSSTVEITPTDSGFILKKFEAGRSDYTEATLVFLNPEKTTSIQKSRQNSRRIKPISQKARLYDLLGRQKRKTNLLLHSN